MADSGGCTRTSQDFYLGLCSPSGRGPTFSQHHAFIRRVVTLPGQIRQVLAAPLGGLLGSSTKTAQPPELGPAARALGGPGPRPHGPLDGLQTGQLLRPGEKGDH